MTSCKKHSESPVKGYNQCAGCEIEALRAEIEELDALRNRQSDLLSQTAIALRGPEPPLTRYSHADIPSRVKTVVAELEAARGLLREMDEYLSRRGDGESIHTGSKFHMAIDAFLTATPAPEMRQTVKQANPVPAVSGIGRDADHPRAMVLYLRAEPTDEDIRAIHEALRTALAEQGERQEASQDVRALAAALYQACGAYDMPDRVLDALSAAANGEPFAHMIGGLLPCVPPSDQDVRALVEALENCAAALAWNCFGECRAVHAGPIIPAAMALDTARAALAAHRQAQRQ